MTSEEEVMSLRFESNPTFYSRLMVRFPLFVCVLSMASFALQAQESVRDFDILYRPVVMDKPNTRQLLPSRKLSDTIPQSYSLQGSAAIHWSS
jgi:hypothetical protein